MAVRCLSCHGSGIVNIATEPENCTPMPCIQCNGTGQVSGYDTLSRQEGGNHYLTMPIQPWHIIDSHGLNFYEGNAIKYILRRKPGQDRVTELKKAIHYLEHLIELEENHDPARNQ